MKTKLFLLFGVIAMFWSCDEDVLTYKFDTTLKQTTIIDIEDNSLKSNAFPFESIDTLNLEDNEDLKKYIDLLNEIVINEISYSLNGIPKGETITKLNIAIEQTDFNVQLLKLSENNTEAVLKISADKLKTVSTSLLTNKKLIIKTIGESTYAPMQLSVELDFDSSITTSL